MKYTLFFLLVASLFFGCNQPKENISKQQNIFDSLEISCHKLIKSRDIPSAMKLIEEVEQKEEFKKSPGNRAAFSYLRMLCYQHTARFDEALSLARELMNILPAPDDTASYECIRLNTLDAMQAANSIFFMKGALGEGADWFHNLRMNPPKVASETCMPDMMTYEAYLRAMSGGYKQGAALMDSARQIPSYRSNPESDYRNSSFAAAIYYNLPERQKDVEALIKQTISQGHKNHFMRGVTWGITALGQLYQKQARYREAIQLQYQGLGIGVQTNDSALCAQCYSCLSELYSKWKLYPQANYYIDKAIQWSQSRAIGNYDKGSNYALKYKTEQLNGRTDPQLFAKADSCFALANVNIARASLIGTKVDNWVNHCPDSIQRGLKLLETLPALAGEGWYRLQYGMEALRTIGLIRIGQEAEARQSLLNIKEYHPSNDYSYLDTLMKHYLQLGDKEAIAHITRLREPLSATYHKEQTVNAVMAADVRFQTEQKEQENRLLTTEIALKDSRLHTYIITGVSLLLIALTIGGWLWTRQHSLKLRLKLSKQEKAMAEANLREQSERLQQLIASRQELNNHNEELLRQLTELQAANENTCNLDNVLEHLQPRLLTKEEELQFRSSFSALYPTALHRLRSVCPRATRMDELICMLIVLRQTNEEMANVLGISRPSILQNRYRLRTKLNLPEGNDLDEEIRQLLITQA